MMSRGNMFLNLLKWGDYEKEFWKYNLLYKKTQFNFYLQLKFSNESNFLSEIIYIKIKIKNAIIASFVSVVRHTIG